MSNQELVLSDQTYMPAMSIPQAVARFNTLVEFVQTVMRQDVDYGIIPGTPKPTLLKPGAEKLTTLFGLTTRFIVVEKTEDWTGEAHGSEPFFYYWYRCQLWRGDRLIAEADGSCNSRESKYRWREAKRKCPKCGAAAINRSKYPPRNKPNAEPGYYCHSKAGGCGAEFAADDQAIIGQQTGRTPNPDICDQINTLQKMSQKRALIAATLIGVNASEFFTQDLDDLPMLGNGASYVPPTQTVNTVTGEVIEPLNPAQANPRKASILIRLAALNEEAVKFGLKPSDAGKSGRATEDELIAAGTKLKAQIDEIKRQHEAEQAESTTRDEWDAIDNASKPGEDDLL